MILKISYLLTLQVDLHYQKSLVALASSAARISGPALVAADLWRQFLYLLDSVGKKKIVELY
jgi:hypothetical protein